jgi:hypothetical protein
MEAILAPHRGFDSGHGNWIPDRKPDGPQRLRFDVVLVLLVFVVAVAVQDHLVGIHELFGPPVHFVEAYSLEYRRLLFCLQECFRQGQQSLGRPIPAQGQAEHIHLRVVAAELDRRLAIPVLEGGRGGRIRAVDHRRDVKMLAYPQPLGRVVALLLALLEDLRGSEGIFGTRADLQVRPLGPDVDVRTVLPAVLLFR